MQPKKYVKAVGKRNIAGNLVSVNSANWENVIGPKLTATTEQSLLALTSAIE